MSEKRLGIAQRATLLLLMAEGRGLTNKQIKAIGGFSPLTGKDLTPIARFIDTTKIGREHVHTLTEAGWAWCRDELSEPPSSGSGTAGGALYSLLGGLGRYLSRNPSVKLKDIFSPVITERAEVEVMIRQAYVELRTEPRGWVSLTDLRAKLSGIAKSEVDAVLYQMSRQKVVNIVPPSNRKLMTSADREATIRIGNEDRLHLSIDEP
ncbi:hypothetical protein Rhe02_48820 [Rhizocola hellebori]|uniref:Uncharacterized protein n=1 Tax=Rhizocola hellebori TaxID=1392758 RepID=A0A8J3QC16_9ACTN|nr:hypothetical protein [Rhizocola hellebori]GIH06815.1 hypothetical protein Rhe02_48820 [Rhizocola hellebori]